MVLLAQGYNHRLNVVQTAQPIKNKSSILLEPADSKY